MEALTLVLAAVTAAGVSPAAADDAEHGKPSPEYIEYQKRAEEQGPDPKLETDHYDRQLKLTPEQREKVHALFIEQSGIFKKSFAMRVKFQKEVEALHQRILEANRRFEAEGRVLEDSRASVLRRLRALLTGKQVQAFDVMTAERDRQERAFREKQEAEDVKRLGGDGVQGMGRGPRPDKDKK